MKKNFNTKELAWAGYSLALAVIFYFIAQRYVFGKGIMILAIIAFVINLASAFNIKVPYITDEKKLPKNYGIYAGIITFILFLSYIIFFD